MDGSGRSRQRGAAARVMQMTVVGVLLALLFSLRAVPVARSVPVVSVTKGDTLLVDNDADGLVDPGDTLRYTVTITNSGTTDAGSVTFADTIDANTTLVAGSLRTTPLARNDTYSSLGNVGITVPAGSGLLANDDDPDGTTPPLAAVAAAGGSANGGAFSIGTDGGFSYLPPAGFEGADSFVYTVRDGDGNEDQATVFITVSNVIWFVDNSQASNGSGVLSNPFNNLANFNNSVQVAAGDVVFLYSGSGAYGGGIVLDNDQLLIGQGAGASLASIAGLIVPPHSNSLPATGGSPPLITNAGGDGVRLAQNNLLRGFAVGDTAGVGISDNGGPVGTLTASEVSIGGSGGGIEVDNGGTLAVTLASLSAVGSADEGIDLRNVGGSFGVSGGGSLSMTGIPAVIVDGNPSLNLNVSLSSVSTSGGAQGIFLQDTTGTFAVVGGTIAAHSAEGIFLNNSGAVSLTDVTVNQGATSDTQGIDATNVSGLTLVRTTVTAGSNSSYALLGNTIRNWSSTNSVYDGGGGTVSAIDAVFITNLLGSNLLDGSTFRNGKDINLLIENIVNGGGQDTITIAGSHFANSGQGDHLQVEADGSANLKLVVRANGAGNSTFSGTGQDGMQLDAQGDATLEALVREATIQNNQGAAVNLGAVVNGRMIAGVYGLTNLSSGASNVLNAAGLDNSQMEVTFEGNTIDMGGTAFAGVRLVQEGNGTVTARVAGNTITGGTWDHGILAQARAGSGTMNATVSGNTVNVSGSFALEGMGLIAGSSSGGDANTICLNLFDNNSSSEGLDGYYLERGLSANFRLQDFGGPATTAGITNWVQSVKNNTGSVFVTGSSGFTAAPEACPTPTTPTAAEGSPALVSPARAVSVPVAAKVAGAAGAVALRTKAARFAPEGMKTPAVSVTAAVARAPRSGETVNVTLGTLNPGQVVTLTFEVTVDGATLPPGVSQICNQALVSGSNFSNLHSDDPDVGGSADPTCTVLDVAVDLVLGKDDGGAAATPGETLAYTLTYTNSGNSTAGGVSLAETVPANTTFNAGASSAGWSCTPDATAGSSCTLAVANVAGGAMGTVTFAVDVTNPLPAAVTVIANSASISSSGTDENPGDNTAGETTALGAFHFYGAPDAATCAAAAPCLYGASALQAALDALDENGRISVLGDHALAAPLMTANSGAQAATVEGPLGFVAVSITGANGLPLFSVGSGDLTVRGLVLAAAGGPVFAHSGSGGLQAYANNIDGWSGDPHQDGGGPADLGNNYWGITAYDAADPGLPVGDWARRLGAPVNGWAYGSGGATLGAATLNGGTGTAVIVNHGRGSSAAPFGSGLAPYADQTCSDYYDFFVRAASGTWAVGVPVDNNAPCTTDTDNPLTNDKLFAILDLAECVPGSTACWDLAPNRSHTAGQLLSTGLTPAQLADTPFVAGTPAGLDPTAVRVVSAGRAGSGLPLWAPPLLLVLLLGTSLVVWRKGTIAKKRTANE